MAFPPPLIDFNSETHRLIPSLHTEPPGTVFADLANDPDDLESLVLLDGASNDRVQAELFGTPGISTFELVYGVPNAHIINAAFAHPSPEGARFSDASRGAWYAAPLLSTALAEITFHKQLHLSQLVVPELPFERPDRESFTYDDWAANFHAPFHHLEQIPANARFLQPGPVPRCYVQPQQLARKLLDVGSNGIVYNSVRSKAPALCIVCFRPALVYNVRPLRSHRIDFTSTPAGYHSTVHRA
jgi:hypothetical protein